MSGFKSGGRLFRLVTWAALLAAAGCSSVPRVASSGEGAQNVRFPGPARSTFPEGRFVNLENLRKVQTGMTKRQLYALLGTPHFNEGVIDVRSWNYIFDFRGVPGGAGNTSCQYQVVFDTNHHAGAMYWKPASCSAVLADQAPVLGATPMAPEGGTMPDQPIRLSADALFAFDRAQLTVKGRQDLSHLLQQVQQASRLQHILIIGYADRLGSESHNLMLSKHRADVVAHYLAEGGVPATAMTSAGRGSEEPVVQCSNPQRSALIECLSPNRRVELSGAVQR